MRDQIPAGETYSSHDREGAGGSNNGERGAKRSPSSVFSTLLFYLALFLVLLAALSYSQGGAGANGKELFGYRFYTVLTSSMDSVIPEGSLVVVQSADPSTLNVGQDITFYKDEATVVTHRIEAISQEVAQDGTTHLAFTTKGVDNPNQDPEPVFDDNVVGKVKFHIPALGKISTFIVDNILWVAGAFAILMLMSFALRLIFTKDVREEDPPPVPPPTFLNG